MSITLNSEAGLSSIEQKVSRLRENFNRGMTRSAAYRQQQLEGLLRFLQQGENEIIAALRADLGKSAAEALATEILFTIAEVELTLKNLRRWMKPRKVHTPLIAQPGKSVIYPEPLGVVLIVGPWNYPVQTILAPLIGALAAGNCAVIKPSECAVETSKLLAHELPHYIDPQCLSVIEGGIPETTELLAQRFDHIFYTGNGKVGRVVMTAAAKHLTPVTLELGGKSPCIVDATANLDVAAERIVWGKFTNAGQTCVAPDYVLVEAAVEVELIKKMQQAVRNFYGADPKTSRDYGRIINRNHYQRLLNLIPGSGDIVIGGSGDEKECYLAPTILRNVPADAPVMADEIFGPVLPIISVPSVKDAIRYIHTHSKPLALYLFTTNAGVEQQVITETSSGGVCVNYTMLHLTVPDLPFGGVGASGMGVYHGKTTFDTFTHYKSVLFKPSWFNPSFLYPPYQSWFIKLLRYIM